jgi:hypothetical protein
VRHHITRQESQAQNAVRMQPIEHPGNGKLFFGVNQRSPGHLFDWGPVIRKGHRAQRRHKIRPLLKMSFEPYLVNYEGSEGEICVMYPFAARAYPC